MNIEYKITTNFSEVQNFGLYKKNKSSEKLL